MSEFTPKGAAPHESRKPPEGRSERESYRWKDGRRREHRPMDYYLQEVLDQVATHQISIVQAETGVGKTTRIPQAILDYDPKADVWMSQTRRPAVRMNGAFIAQEMGSRKGGVVGWRLRGEDPVISDETRLTLLIDQSLTNRIRKEKKLPEGYIIIDEAHERTVQVDVLLALIKLYAPNSPKTKIIVTSATIDTEKFRNFFNAPEPIVAKNEQLYPVEVKPYRLSKGEHHTQGAARALEESVIKPFAHGTLTIPGLKPEDAPQKVTSGTVAVLLPGKEDIRAVMNSAQNVVTHLGIAEKVEILQVHGQMKKSEQDKVGEPVPEGVLRIVCATDIMRSSVTGAQVVGVIDSLQVKRNSTDNNGVRHLGKVSVSGAEADQGKGRAGRTGTGFYIPISFQNEYEHMTNRANREYWPKPAILRDALTSVVLQIAAMDLSIRELPLLDKPTDAMINLAISRLRNIGALDENEKITELGKLLVEFPIDPEAANALVHAEKRNVLPEAIIATSIIENEGLFFSTRDRTAFASAEVVEQILRVLRTHGTHSSDTTPEEYSLTNLPTWIMPTADGKYRLSASWSDGFPKSTRNSQIHSIGHLLWKDFANGTGSDFYASIQAFRAFKAEQRRLKGLSNEELGLQDNSVSRDLWIEELEREWCLERFINYKKIKMVEAQVRDLRKEVASSTMVLKGDIYKTRDFNLDDLTKSLMGGYTDNVAWRNGVFGGPLASEMSTSFASTYDKQDRFIFVGGVRKDEYVLDGKDGVRYLVDLATPVKEEWFKEVAPLLCAIKVLEDTALYDKDQARVLATYETYFGSLKYKEERLPLRSERGTEHLVEALLFSKTGHRCEEFNEKKIKYVRNLLVRAKLDIDLHEPTKKWLTEQVKGATSLAEIQDLDLIYTDEVISSFLGFDFKFFVEKTVAEKPDLYVISGYECRAEYESYTHHLGSKPYVPKFVAKLYLPVALISTFEPHQLPEITGFEISIRVSDDRFGMWFEQDGKKTWSEFQEAVEDRRLYNAWNDFTYEQYDRHEFQLPYQHPFPPHPEPKIWDEKTKALAYPAYFGNGPTYTSMIWKRKWFKTQEEAEVQQLQAEELRQKINRSIYEKLHRTEILTEAANLYPEVEALLQEINLEEPDFYGLNSIEAATGPYASDKSLRKVLETIKQQLDQAERNSKPLDMLESLQALKNRLVEAQAFYATQGQELIRVQQEKLAMKEPWPPKGTTPLFVYRTTAGRLFASPAAGTTSSWRTGREYDLKGTDVEYIGDEVSQRFDQLIRADRHLNVVTSSKWYRIPESGAFEVNETNMSGTAGGRWNFAVDTVPSAPGLYAIFTEAVSSNTGAIPSSVVEPISYGINNRHRIALTLYEITKWLEHKEKQYKGRLNPEGRITSQEAEFNQKEVWYDAKSLFQRLKRLDQTWLSEAELETLMVDESAEVGPDLIDDAFLELTRVQSMNIALGKLFEGTGDVPPSAVVIENALTSAELKRLTIKIQEKMPTSGFGSLARQRLSTMTTILNQELTEDQRKDYEVNLRVFAFNQGLTPDIIDGLRAMVRGQTPSVRQEIIEDKPLKLRIDEFYEITRLDLTQLREIVERDKDRDVGKWRLAVAALTTKGEEGMAFLNALKLSKDAQQAIIKALTKALTEAQTHKREDVIEIQQELTGVIDALEREEKQKAEAERIKQEMAPYVEVALKHELVRDFLGDDGQARDVFVGIFTRILQEQKTEWGQYPPIDKLDPLIELALDEQTS